MAAIESITLHRLSVPLCKPYKLAFGPVTAFDTVIVELRDSDGHEGFGEGTLLTGYTDETIDRSWTTACSLAEELINLDADHLQARLQLIGRRAPFTATAYMTAWEMLSGNPLLTVSEVMRVPLVGLLGEATEGAARDEFERLVAEGYATIKVKVGFDIEQDIGHVAMVQRIVAGRAAIRIDANQGYTADQAAAFLSRLDPEGIELFEQPCTAGDWPAHAYAAQFARVPLMLDESIYALADIDRAADGRIAHYIKLKLMKLTSLSALVNALRRIRARGMRPVLGNGVACEPGCWMEACVAARHIDNAGEMNGFLKPVAGLFETPLHYDRGAILLTPGYRPQLDQETLTRFGVANKTLSA